MNSALDFEARKKSEMRNVKLLRQLERSNNELSEYAHVVSHDLKSPLRSINALTAWIREDNFDTLNTKSKEHFDLLESTIDKMEKLISNVLKYAAIDQSDEDFSVVDTGELVCDIVKTIYIPSRIEVQIPKRLPVVLASRVMLQQLFQNLMVNAIKYNDKEKGFVRICSEDKETFYQFSVTDNGQGIPPEYHEKIFKIFQSLNPDGESNGLGLALVKKVVEFYDGEVWLESTPGEGTTFYFTLSKKK